MWSFNFIQCFNIDNLDKAIADPEILGYAFENQVIKDLSVYMQSLGGKN